MFGIGMTELWMILGVIFFVSLTSLRRGGSIHSFTSTTLVLRRFRIIRNPASPTDSVIQIAGRPSGIISWILTTIGLADETTLVVTGREITFLDASIRGQHHSVVSLTSISSLHCGYIKPIWPIVVAGMCFLGGIAGALKSDQEFGSRLGSLGGGLVVGGIFLLFYWLSRRINIRLQARGSAWLGLTFKPSVIENVQVDIGQAKNVIGIIHALVMQAQHREIPVETVIAEAAGGTPEKTCASCGTQLDAESRFCVSCGKQVP